MSCTPRLRSAVSRAEGDPLEGVPQGMRSRGPSGRLSLWSCRRRWPACFR